MDGPIERQNGQADMRRAVLGVRAGSRKWGCPGNRSPSSSDVLLRLCVRLGLARRGVAWRSLACVGRERPAGSSGRSRCCPQASTRSSPSTGVSVSLRHYCGATSQRMQPCAMQHNTPPDRSACTARRHLSRENVSPTRSWRAAHALHCASLQHARRDVAGDCATRACSPVHSVAKLYLPLMLSMLEIVRRMIWAVFR